MCGLQAPWVLGTHRQYIGHLPAVCKRKQSLLRRAGCLRWMRLFGDSRQRQSNPSRRPQLLQQLRPPGRLVLPVLQRSDTAAQIHSPMIIHASNKKLDGLCTLSVHCTVSSVQCTEPDIAICHRCPSDCLCASSGQVWTPTGHIEEGKRVEYIQQRKLKSMSELAQVVKVIRLLSASKRGMAPFLGGVRTASNLCAHCPPKGTQNGTK